MKKYIIEETYSEGTNKSYMINPTGLKTTKNVEKAKKFKDIDYVNKLVKGLNASGRFVAFGGTLTYKILEV